MFFNVNKRHILEIGTSGYEINGTKFESVQYVKDLGVTIASSLIFSQQCKDTAGKANRMLGFITKIYPFKIKTKFYHCISA